MSGKELNERLWRILQDRPESRNTSSCGSGVNEIMGGEVLRPIRVLILQDTMPRVAEANNGEKIFDRDDGDSGVGTSQAFPIL